jgi:hypothetical protein
MLLQVAAVASGGLRDARHPPRVAHQKCHPVIRLARARRSGRVRSDLLRRTPSLRLGRAGQRLRVPAHRRGAMPMRCASNRWETAQSIGENLKPWGRDPMNSHAIQRSCPPVMPKPSRAMMQRIVSCCRPQDRIDDRWTRMGDGHGQRWDGIGRHVSLARVPQAPKGPGGGHTPSAGVVGALGHPSISVSSGAHAFTPRPCSLSTRTSWCV